MLDLLSKGWVGSLIGLIGLIVGTIGLILYLRSRIGPRPTYRMRARRLLGKKEQELPDDVEILFKGRPASRLTLTYVVFWNSGTSMIRGDDIVASAPLTMEFDDKGEILQARLAAVTRDANNTRLMHSGQPGHAATVTFNYFDPGDGFVVELLHTSEAAYPKLSGTIRGIPGGLKYWGPILSVTRRVRMDRPRYLAVGTGFGAILLLAALVPDSLPFLVQSPRVAGAASLVTKGILIALGIIYTLMPLLLLRLLLRRIPEPLRIRELTE